VTLAFGPSVEKLIGLADVLARYGIGIPAALAGTWALMVQQRTFREHDMPQFGRYLVWGAMALFLYGVIGQFFVRQSLLFPSTMINGRLFLDWFGIPVQLFRGVMAAILAFYMVRALKAFELENQRRLDGANQAVLEVQIAALEAEREITKDMERLNEELRLAARELSLLLDLSNVLAGPMSVEDRLHSVLQKIVQSLSFPEAGLIMLIQRETDTLRVKVSSGFTNSDQEDSSRYNLARNLGEQCVVSKMAMCRHLDGQVLEFLVEEALEQQQCRQYQSPTIMISLPLTAQQQVIGSIVLVQPKTFERRLAYDEFKLMVGISQQLGLSIENARLYHEAQKREKVLADLLHQVVEAQETERKRIARELHDATGQSLTAINLGLRGVENLLADSSPRVAAQIKELKSFGTNALDELRQIITDLRPSQLDDLGLVPTLQWYIGEFEKRRSIPVDFIIEGDQARLPSEYEIVLFRITQEALTNIAKHAKASYVAVTVHVYSGQICVMIEDDGCGFEPATVLDDERQLTGFGLLGIRERTLLLGGHYEIDSKPGRGTFIRVSVPLVVEWKNAKEDTVTAG
jgi:signal transduction histidine kinase